MRRAKRIITGLLCVGMLIGNAGSVHAQEDVSQEQVTEEQNVLIVNEGSSKDASMDGQRRLDEIYRVDENGNTSLIEDSSSDTALPADDEEDSDDRARSTSVKIVNFRANKKGEAVSSSQSTGIYGVQDRRIRIYLWRSRSRWSVSWHIERKSKIYDSRRDR